MNINKLREEELKQLTGCPYAVLVRLKNILAPMLARRGAGSGTLCG